MVDRGRARRPTSAPSSPTRRPEGRGEDQGRRRAQGPHRRQEPGRTSPGPSRPTRRPRRRPATSAGSGQRRRDPTRTSLKAALRRRRQHADRRSSRAATASIASVAPPRSPRVGRHRLPGQDRQRRHRRSTSTATSSRRDVIHEKLQAKIVGDVTGPARSGTVVGDLRPARPAPNLGADAIKVRHILYRPKGDPSDASAASRPDDPAWAAAHGQATRDLTSSSRPIPTCSTPIARTESDEGQAAGSDRQRRQAARTSTARARSTTAFLAAHPRARAQGRRHPRPGQVGLRLARHPGHVPPDRRRPSQGAQGRGRQRHGLRDPRPATTPSRPDRRASAATSAGSPRASSTTS